ncbi:dynein 1 light intermediate chain, partial [Moniliophthora roreri]
MRPESDIPCHPTCKLVLMQLHHAQQSLITPNFLLIVCGPHYRAPLQFSHSLHASLKFSLT